MGFQQGFRINTNTASLDTYRAYSKSQAGLEQNIERLSSGLRINSAKDDAADLAISERMNNQVRGMQQANRNVQQGMNMLQTAEGGLNEISNILGRMRELAVQGASDTVNTSDRDSLNLAYGQLKAEIDRIAESTEYNGKKLLRGATVANGGVKSSYDNNHSNATSLSHLSFDSGAHGAVVDGAQDGTYTISMDATAGSETLTLTSADGRSETVDVASLYDANSTNDKFDTGDEIEFKQLGISIQIEANDTMLSKLENKTIKVNAGATLQVGADNNSNNQLSFGIAAHTTTGLALAINNTVVSGASPANAQVAISFLDTAINTVNDTRSDIGALQNRLEFTSSNLMNSIQNTAASMSTIRDADFAAEAAELAKNQILTQAGTAMLAQANSLSQNVLSLIR